MTYKTQLLDSVVYHDHPYVIVKSVRVFGIGFNVYEETEVVDGGPISTYVKINDRMSWFKTEEAAREWLEKYKANERRTSET